MNQKMSEVETTKHKQVNIMKDIKSQQEKEVLAHKGQFKSKTILMNSTSRSKLLFGPKSKIQIN
jgi:hypothetical protein